MKILGLDLSINSTGVCVYDNELNTNRYYVVTSDASLTKKQRTQIALLESEYEAPIRFLTYYKAHIDTSSYNAKEEAKTSNIVQIAHLIDRIIKDEQPVFAFVEGISYGSRNSQALADLAGLNYVVRYILTANSVCHEIVTPTVNKKLFTGNGSAKKDEMKACWFVCDDRLKQYDNVLKLDDLADAYALAHISTRNKQLYIL